MRRVMSCRSWYLAATTDLPAWMSHPPDEAWLAGANDAGILVRPRGPIQGQRQSATSSPSGAAPAVTGGGGRSHRRRRGPSLRRNRPSAHTLHHKRNQQQGQTVFVSFGCSTQGCASHSMVSAIQGKSGPVKTDGRRSSALAPGSERWDPSRIDIQMLSLFLEGGRFGLTAKRPRLICS